MSAQEDDTKWLIEPDDIEWEMDYGEGHGRAKTGKHMIFEHSAALAHLLLNNVCYLNSFWWKAERLKTEDGKLVAEPDPNAKWTIEEAKTTAVLVNTNDIFAWACADAEELHYNQIEPLYKRWIADPQWGVVKWVCLLYKHRPQAPIERDMKAQGAWCAEMEALPPRD